MRVQVQLDWAEIAHTGEARDGHERIDRAKNHAKPPRAIGTLPETGPESDYSTGEVKDVMGGRKCEVEHFMAKEPHRADHNQDRPAQHNIDLCQPARHSLLLDASSPMMQSRNAVELTARTDAPSSPR